MKNMLMKTTGRYSRIVSGKKELVRFSKGDVIEVADEDVAHIEASGAGSVQADQQAAKNAGGKETPQPRQNNSGGSGREPESNQNDPNFASRLMGVKGMTEDTAKKLVANGFNTSASIKAVQKADWFKKNTGIDNTVLKDVKEEFDK